MSEQIPNSKDEPLADERELKDKRSGDEREELYKAIISAYPDHAALERVIDYKLNENLDVIAGTGTHGDVVYRLIKWANAEGKLETLIVALYNDKSSNQQLKAIKQKLLPNASKPGNLTFDNVPITFSDRLRKLLPVSKRITTVSVGVTALVAVMRLFGILQGAELWFFDQMMQLQPIEEQDQRLLVVEVTKKDIDNQKGFRQGSLTDETLLNLLNKLLQNQPRAIGLDIHRDFPTQTPKLFNLLKSNSPIFAVCNVGDLTQNNDGVKPPPEIPRERLGFSDSLSDSEGLVRRQILSMQTLENSPCWSSDKKPVNTALSLELARHYLNKPYEEPFKDEKIHLPLGNTAFEQLYGPYRGGYSIWTDLYGYQLLLNYRRSCSEKNKNNCSPEFIAKKVSVEDVLKTDLLEKYSLKDRIVLIGVTDVSYEAPWFTPFSSAGNQPISGVVMQAQMVSQILSAVLDKRPLLKVWSIWYEMLWIMFWSLVGGTIACLYPSNLCPSKRYLIIYGGIAFIGLCSCCFFFFISSIKWWVPFVPPTLALLGTEGIVVFIKLKI
ncbi:CHASE2 domain-containing protein [Nostoc sp.]|uniref:CHASE2 domain-containing protein n=1 Tax=Nostoc sp. TaxID=1180 RepID=UPI002FF634F7